MGLSGIVEREGERETYYRDPRVFGDDIAKLPLVDVVALFPCPSCQAGRVHWLCTHWIWPTDPAERRIRRRPMLYGSALRWRDHPLRTACPTSQTHTA